MFEKLPGLKLLTTTGMVNRGIDLDAAKAHNVMVCGTSGYGNPTAGIADCWARAVSGHAAAALATSVMNCRRFIRSPRRRAGGSIVGP